MISTSKTWSRWELQRSDLQLSLNCSSRLCNKEIFRCATNLFLSISSLKSYGKLFQTIGSENKECLGRILSVSAGMFVFFAFFERENSLFYLDLLRRRITYCNNFSESELLQNKGTSRKFLAKIALLYRDHIKSLWLLNWLFQHDKQEITFRQDIFQEVWLSRGGIINRLTFTFTVNIYS